MFSNRIYFKLFCNLIVARSLSTGGESIKSASNDKDHSMEKLELQSEVRSKRGLNALEQEGSAKYSFYLLLFDLAQRLNTDQNIEYNATFADEVENVAGANNQRTLKIRDFDRVVNGINRTRIQPDNNYLNYTIVLQGVLEVVNFLNITATHARAIRLSEIESLESSLRASQNTVLGYKLLITKLKQLKSGNKSWKT